MHHHGAVLRGQANDGAVELQVHALGGRVLRERDEDHLRLLGHRAVVILQPVQKRGGIGHGHQDGVAFGHEHAVLVNGIAGIRRGHVVAGPDHREQQVGQRVLGAHGGDRLDLRVELDAVLGLVPLDDLLAQARNALGHGVAVVAGIPGGFHQLFNHDRRRRTVGIAHAQIDHIELCRAQPGLHLVHHGEDVGRQLGDAVEVLDHRFPLYPKVRFGTA